MSQLPSKLVSTYRENHGIPQGTPLSGGGGIHLDARIPIRAVKAAVDACGGSYRRYSDDILILCAPEYIAALEGEVNRALKLPREDPVAERTEAGGGAVLETGSGAFALPL